MTRSQCPFSVAHKKSSQADFFSFFNYELPVSVSLLSCVEDGHKTAQPQDTLGNT
jgi:hypothetical protein